MKVRADIVESLRRGAFIPCICGGRHPVVFWPATGPVVVCPESSGRFPALFADRTILEIERVMSA